MKGSPPVTGRCIVRIKAVLFDLGGVLVELTGVPRMMELTGNRFTVPELWKRWLNSPVIRRYETGRMSTGEFGIAIVKEFSMDIDPRQYVKEFTAWPAGKFSGVNELLGWLKEQVVLASLSNTNDVHWKRVVEEMDFIHLFDYNFPSHETGLLKPDLEAYLHVAESIGLSPEEILFFDDNEINVRGAEKAGMKAVRAAGIDEVTAYCRRRTWRD